MDSIPNAEHPAPQGRTLSRMSGSGNPPSPRAAREPPANRRQAGTTPQDDNKPQKCFVCGKEVPAGGWFCRIPREEDKIVLCSPLCALGYFDAFESASNPDKPDLADYEHRVRFFTNGD